MRSKSAIGGGRRKTAFRGIVPRREIEKITFYSATLALGAGAAKYADYFETCRRKRNVIDYTRSHVSTETEAKEIVEKATVFCEFVEAWIDSKFPILKR